MTSDGGLVKCAALLPRTRVAAAANTLHANYEAKTMTIKLNSSRTINIHVMYLPLSLLYNVQFRKQQHLKYIILGCGAHHLRALASNNPN
jgi:hypothetical protein